MKKRFSLTVRFGLAFENRFFVLCYLKCEFGIDK